MGYGDVIKAQLARQPKPKFNPHPTCTQQDYIVLLLCIMTSLDIVLAGGLSIKKAESYYWEGVTLALAVNIALGLAHKGVVLSWCTQLCTLPFAIFVLD